MPGSLIHCHCPSPPCSFGLAHLSSAYPGSLHSHAEFLQLDTEDQLHLKSSKAIKQVS